VPGDDWFRAIDPIRRAFESGSRGTFLGEPGRLIARLPDALGGDSKQWPLLAAPAKGKAGFFALFQAKARFLMLPRRIVDAMMESDQLAISEKPIPAAFKGETQQNLDPRSAEIRIPGVSDALARAGGDLGRVDLDPGPYDQYNVFGITYHELMHAWLWLQEFYDDEIGKLYRDGLAAYVGSTGVAGTIFAPHSAFSEAAAYYVSDRIRKWCTALRSLDRLLRAPPADRTELETYLQSIVEGYNRVPTDAWVRLDGDALEKIASPMLSDALRHAIDEKILEGRPLTEPFDETPLAGLRASLLAR
jgi:hypothetical protein